MCTPHAFTPTAARMAAIRGPRRRPGLSRRDLLRGGAAAALAVAGGRGVLGGLLGRPALAQALEQAGICVPEDRISIQLFTMAETYAADFEGTVAELARIGYRIVEHAGTDAAEGGSPEAFRAVHDAAGIAITSGHRSVPFPYDEERWQQVLAEAQVLGCTRINEPLPAFLLPDLLLASQGAPAGMTTSVQYGQFADALNQAGAAAQAVGITVGYHNHNPEFLLLPDAPGMKGYDVLLAETDPELVDFEMDVYWVTAGGEDAVARLQAHEGRFAQLHIKDMAEDGSITFPGTGIIDFAAIVAEGARQGIAEYIVEQDNADAEGVRAAELGYQLLSAGCAAPPPAVAEVIRVAGAGRADTAAALSARRTAPGVAVAYVAAGGGFADALAAGPAAAAEGAPLLLVDRDAVPAATRAELERLQPAAIVVAGGPAAVSGAVVEELRGLTDGEVERRAGGDRYATAAAVAEAAFAPGLDRVVVATGADFPDALAGGTAARGGPVLLTERDVLPAATRDALRRLAPAAITVVGGTAAVSDAVAEELAEIAPTDRVDGFTRFETAAAAAQAVTATGGTVYVATGADFPDALAATAAAAAEPEAVLLVERDALPDPTRDALVRLAPATVLVLGGPAAVGEDVLDAIRAALAAG
jgi:putative cell wall-binding protein/sugar phosphate isomerase/epimerase